MSYYTVRLSANKPTLVQVAGTVILIDDLGGAPGVDIMPSYGGRDLPTMPNRKKAFKFSEPFDAVTLTATVDCTVALFLSKNDVDLGFADGSLVNVSGDVAITNGAGARVPVDIGGGTVQVTASGVTINNPANAPVPVASALATTLENLGAFVINAGAAQALPVDAALRSLRIKNNSATATVYIGYVGVTPANAAIILAPGDLWIEDTAPGAQWYATSDTNGADVRVQGVK